jgi:hypothetical protein
MTAAPVLTLTPAERASLGPIERAALAIGTGLVAWSRRAAQRGAARAAARSAALANLVDISANSSPDLDSRRRELHSLRRAALHERAAIETARDLGINQLWR